MTGVGIPVFSWSARDAVFQEGARVKGARRLPEREKRRAQILVIPVPRAGDYASAGKVTVSPGRIGWSVSPQVAQTVSAVGL